MRAIVLEYGFELRLCAHLETITDGIVARQIGGGVGDRSRRILDIVVVEPGREFETRTEITERSIPPAAIHSDVGIGRAVRWARATALSPEAASPILEKAVEIGFFERVQHNGAVRVRQTIRYPDWIGPITGIENKPDLGTPGALSDQLRFDVALGLVDRVILATASHVTAAHLNRIPEEVGVWRVTKQDGALIIDEIRPPTDLSPDAWGIELGDRETIARRIHPISPTEKQRARVRLAERAYGKGWRPTFPHCANIRKAEVAESRALPFCRWYDDIVDPGECGPRCPGYDRADPPDVDHTNERAERTPWKPDPRGYQREQTDLTSFESTGD